MTAAALRFFYNSVLVGAVTLLLRALRRPLGRHVAARGRCLIWLVLAVRLLIPWQPALPGVAPLETISLPAVTAAPAAAAGQGAFAGRPAYTDEVLLHWLENFYRRFFAQQFKRSCLPDGPKVGSVTLSPRGDWRMPSDASAALWAAELETLRPAKANP